MELIEALKGKGADVYNPKVDRNRGESNSFYHQRLCFWDRRFPRDRPGYATNKQLALIETFWSLDFHDGRTQRDRGLRGFIYRQTRSLADGPVEDLAFLRGHHVEAVLAPLKLKARKKQHHKEKKGG